MAQASVNAQDAGAPARDGNIAHAPPGAPPAPRAAAPREALPHALTFFLTGAQRSRVLARLSRVHRDRATALLIALGASDGS